MVDDVNGGCLVVCNDMFMRVYVQIVRDFQVICEVMFFCFIYYYDFSVI